MKKRALLVITDGLGHNTSSNYNAFNSANTPFYDFLFKNVPYNYIETSGEAVGLPKGTMGNSEVGHMILGSGRIIKQNLIKIHEFLNSNKVGSNSTFKKLNSAKVVHLIGLCSDGCVHSDISHMLKLIELLDNNNKKIWLHLFSDGRDVSPTTFPSYISIIKKYCNDNIKIATIGGRYYGMDRDNRWDRVKKSYESIVYGKNIIDSLDNYIKNSYEKEVTDEFIIPATLKGYGGMNSSDTVCFTNYRSDRARELSMALALDNFSEFDRKFVVKNYITMTEYDEKFNFPILQPKESIKNYLSDVISKEKLMQMHIAETEKYAHVTFFFNAGIELPHLNESRVMVASPKINTYDNKPEMSANEVTNNVLKSLDMEYDFIVVNFANPDMVGHTGNYEASIKAVEVVDECLSKIHKKAKELDYSFILTSDHGNVESMRDDNGNILTNHTTFEVYCFIDSLGINSVNSGALNNVAPTILKLMGISIPEEMDESLV